MFHLRTRWESSLYLILKVEKKTQEEKPMTQVQRKSDSSVVSLMEFRSRKMESGTRKLNLSSTFTGKKGSLVTPDEQDLNIRLERIKQSIQRINQLMQDLKNPAQQN
jgi:hypothetical protein